MAPLCAGDMAPLCPDDTAPLGPSIMKGRAPLLSSSPKTKKKGALGYDNSLLIRLGSRTERWTADLTMLQKNKEL